MPDKTYGINSVLLDSLKLEEHLLDIDRPICSHSLDNLRADLDNLRKQILFCFDYNGCAMHPALPSATYLPYRVQETIDHAMQNALNRTLAAIDSADECIEMEFILSQFYTGYADKDEVARGVVVQLRVHRAAQHRHCWALAANKGLWKHASA